MSIQYYSVHVDGKKVAHFGINALTTPDCGFYQQLADALASSEADLKPKSEIDLFIDDQKHEKLRSFQYNTLKRYLGECEDVVE